MPDLSEKQKVGALQRLLEDSFKGELSFRKEGKEHKVGRIYPVRRGFGKEEGRPDIVLWVELDTSILGAFIKAKFPILVEAEESGWANATADYEAFFSKDETLIPMVIIGGDRKEESLRTISAKAKLSIKQVPTQLVIKT